LTGARSRDCS